MGFYAAGGFGAKKGGVDELGKLRSGAQRNGAILTFFFFLSGAARTAGGGLSASVMRHDLIIAKNGLKRL